MFESVCLYVRVRVIMIVPMMMRVALMIVVVMRVSVCERRATEHRAQAADEKAKADA